MQEDDDTLEATGESPRKRLITLSGRLVTSVLAGVTMMFASFVLGYVLQHSATTTYVYRQMPEEDYQRGLAQLRQTDLRLDIVRRALADNPEALKAAEESQADVRNFVRLLDSLPTFTRREPDIEGVWLPSLVTQAFAQEGTSPRPTETDPMQRYLLFGLVGVVVFVMVMLTLMYMYTSDKTKKAFAEKTITTGMGFIFGLITGSFTGKYR